jgi:hypothetical protein
MVLSGLKTTNSSEHSPNTNYLFSKGTQSTVITSIVNTTNQGKEDKRKKHLIWHIDTSHIKENYRTDPRNSFNLQTMNSSPNEYDEPSHDKEFTSLGEPKLRRSKIKLVVM